MLRRLLLFALLFCINTTLKAQSVITPALSDTLLLSEVEERNQLTYLKDLDSTATAVIVDYYDSGQLKLRRSVVDGMAEGLWMEWYETGIPRFIAEWQLGRGHGQWMYFHENGQLRARETVEDDIWHGISESWYANGQKRSEGHHRQGQKHGTWNYWNKDGSHQKTEQYTNGTLISTYNSNAK